MAIASNRFDWRHVVLAVCGVGTSVCAALVYAGQNGQSLPLFLSTGVLATATMVFGFISRSLTLPTVAPVVVAVSRAGDGPAVVVPSIVVPPQSTTAATVPPPPKVQS